MRSNCQLEHEKGSAEWVRALLLDLSTDDWARRPACADLVEWLYDVTRNRARRMGAPPRAQGEIVQDVVSSVVMTLHGRRVALAAHTNPASALEFLVIHGMHEVVHDHQMHGYGGVAKNGRNWVKPRPRQSTAFNIDESLAAPALLLHADDRIAAAAHRLHDWVERQLRLRLTASALDATTYVLDRLRAGKSRTTLLRGGHSSLRHDPAMQHLGFDPESSSAFGTWLLGRPERRVLGVIDAAVLEIHAGDRVCARWRAVALRSGFGEPSRTPPPSNVMSPSPAPEVNRLIA